jgi:hypothetical protein
MEILNEVYNLDKVGNNEAAIKLLNNIVSDIQQEGISCDELITEFLKIKFSVLMFVELTMITKPIKNNLDNRQELLSKLKIKLHETCSYDEAENIYNNIE